MLSAPRRRRLATLALVGSLALAAGPAAASGAAGGDDLDLERGAQATGQVASPEPVDVAPAPATRSVAASGATLAQRLQARSDVLAPGFSGRVVQVSDGALVWTRSADTALMPGSSQKLVTALTALRTFGTGHQYKTAVLRRSSSPSYVYLRGSGDPTLSSYRLRVMAAEVATSQRRLGRTRVNLRYDDTLLPTPTNASGWESSDVPRWVTPVRALVRDQLNLSDTSRDAATYFAGQLEARGLTVVTTSRARTPSGAAVISSRSSPAMRTIVADMLRTSQNDYAESLLWTAGVRAGAPRTWAGVTSHARRTLLAEGVPTAGVVVRDGSGISRGDRQSGRALITLVRTLRTDRVLGPVVYSAAGLPVAGRTGTLANRFVTAPTSCAAGRVRAKTGSLRDAGVLAGIAVGTDGTERAFAFVSNGRPNDTTLRGQLDVLAATTVTCM